MTVKESVLAQFEAHRGQFLSGGELAAQLGVSRNAVWKAVKQLEAEGYRFDSTSGKGYRLREESSRNCRMTVRRNLPCWWPHSRLPDGDA